MSEKAQRKKPGRKPGSRVTHGAYSLVARGEFPSKRCYIECWLSEVRAGLIRDLGHTETDLSTGQAILIDRIIGKLGILRCIEEHVRERGVMKGNELSPPLGKNYLGWANSLRLDLLALGISKKNGERILTPLEIAAEIDREKGSAQGEARPAEAGTGGPGMAQEGRSSADEGQVHGRRPERRRGMTKGKAIKLFCLDCAGGTAKEVTLCGIADCPLWEHRLGCSPRTRQYQTRVAGALRAHPGLVKELREAGVDMAVFSCEHARNGLPGENFTRSRVRAGLGSLSKTPSNKSALSPVGTSSGG